MSKDFTMCPLIRAECMRHQCAWYIHMQGKNPQTGADVSEFGCAVTWLPLLLVDSTRVAHQAVAATESFRNEFCDRSDKDLSSRLLSLEALQGGLHDASRLDRLPPGDAGGRG